MLEFLRVYRRVVGLLAAERGLAAALVAANLLLAVLRFAEPILFGQVVEVLSGAASRTRDALWRDVLRLLMWWAAIGAAAIGVAAWVTVHTDRLAHRRRLAAMSAYFEHVLRLPLAFHARTHSGRLLKIMLQGTDQLFGTWLSVFREHLGTVVSVLVLMPLTFFMNWRLALLVMALFVAFVALTVLTVWRTERAQKRVEGYHSDLAERAGDALANLSVIQTFSRAPEEVESLRERMRDVIRAQFPVLKLWAFFSVLTSAASTITVVLIFLAGTWLHLRGQASLGEVVAFVGIAMQLVGRLEQLASFFNRMLFQAPVLAEFFAVLDEQPGIVQARSPVRVGRLHGAVRYEDVGFSYDGRRPALQALDLDVPAGTTVALVGRTGAGKSTALALLCRLWDPQHGRILIDGIDIRALSLDALRDNIAVVLQEPTLFRRTIAENLRVGRPDASDADLVRAARLAEAHDFIVAQPEGYDTVLGERGRSLSGGERQRLAIARAILKDAPILVLDEATSALDNRTEALVQRALAALTRGRTTFVIAHRLSTVRHADRVVVMEAGRIVEQGTHDALAARGGAFAALLQQMEPGKTKGTATTAGTDADLR